jgi:hypothetical protein
MNRYLFIVIGFLVVLALAASQTPKVEVPRLSTELDDFGARPGTFHFVTNEQSLSNAANLQKAFAALDSLDAATEKLDPRVRTRMSSDLNQLRQLVNDVHAQSIGNAGKTAGEVEERLNAAKGKFMCGACHGHGMGMMRHGRPME